MDITKLDISKLTQPQLAKISNSLDYFIFTESSLFMKGEPFAPSYKKNAKHFKDIITLMVGFKREVMAYFKKQYENRYNLVRVNLVKAAEDDTIDQDNGDEGMDSIYIYTDQWDIEDDELAKILQNNKEAAYALGLIGFVNQTGRDTNHSSSDAGYVITKDAQEVAVQINDVTKKRIIQAIKTSLELGENRDDFDKRLKKIFVNPYRGRFIAQNEALQSYLDAKDEAAQQDPTITKKTWVGVQPDDTEICGQVLNETVGINESFSNGLDGPPPHLGCRCDLIYS